MSRILARHCGARMPIALRGDGPCLIDSTGKRNHDASGGAAVSCLDHGDSRIGEAIKRQADALVFADTGFFSGEAAEALDSTPAAA